MGGKRDERERFIKRDLPLVMSKEVHAVVTSYEGLLKEKNKFSKVPFKYLIIDEVSCVQTDYEIDGLAFSHPLNTLFIRLIASKTRNQVSPWLFVR